MRIFSLNKNDLSTLMSLLTQDILSYHIGMVENYKFRSRSQYFTDDTVPDITRRCEVLTERSKEMSARYRFCTEIMVGVSQW